MKNDRIFVLYIEYKNFENLDINDAEIIGTFKNKSSALEKAYHRFLNEIDFDMTCKNFIFDENMTVKQLKNCISNQLEKFGFIQFEQNCGYGTSNLVLTECEVKE